VGDQVTPLREETSQLRAIDPSRASWLLAQLLTAIDGRRHPDLSIDHVMVTDHAVNVVGWTVPDLLGSNMTAFAGIAYEVLTGIAPPAGPLPPIAELRPGLVEGVDAFLAKCRGDRLVPMHARTILLEVLGTSPIRFPRKHSFTTDEPREDELVTALRANPSDAALRAVYADWLEEHARLEDATVLRDGTGGRPGAWRAIVVRAPVRGSTNCVATWDACTPTRFDDLRTCPHCDKVVHYLDDVREAEAYGARNAYFAADPLLPGDQVDNAYREGAFPSPRYMSANPPMPRPPRPGIVGRVRRWLGGGDE